jgi:hypothetical protein
VSGPIPSMRLFPGYITSTRRADSGILGNATPASHAVQIEARNTKQTLNKLSRQLQRPIASTLRMGSGEMLPALSA